MPSPCGSLSRILLIAGFMLVPCSSTARAYTVVKDVIFANVPTKLGSRDLKLDLYLPVGPPAPSPLVIWIHGGGWKSGSKDVIKVKVLADQGYAVASIEYRLSQEAEWPAQIQDCKGAVRFLRKNAVTYNLDPDRFAAWGTSAGAHLAVCLGVMGDLGEVRLGSLTIDLEGTSGGNLDMSSRVQVVVDWYGPNDFLLMNAYPSILDHDAIDSPESLLIGGAIQTLPVAAASASPMSFLSRDDPPMLLAHGTHDQSIPFNQSELLFEKGRLGLGLDYHFQPVQDNGHGGSGFLVSDARAYLDAHLITHPANTLSVQTSGGGLAEGATSGVGFRITRVGSTATPLRVGLHLGGEAVEGVDYMPLGTAAVIPAGSSFIDLHPVPVDDVLVEGDESITMWLRASDDYLIETAQGSATHVLGDNEVAAGLPTVLVSAPDPSATEGAADDAHFTLHRSGSVALPLTVAFRLRGSATAAEDYAHPGGLAVIPASASMVNVPIQVLDNSDLEPSEYVILEIQDGVDYQVGIDRSADAKILDDDKPALLPIVNVFVSDQTMAEGATGTSGAFMFTRTGLVIAPLQVNIAVMGSATGGSDYAAVPSVVTFPGGEAFERLIITPQDDTAVEGDEFVTAMVLPGAGYRVGLQRKRSILLVDDEAALPLPTSVVLEVSSLTLGQPLIASIISPHAASLFGLFVSSEPGYFAAGLSYPLLLASSPLLMPWSGVLDQDGAAHVAAVVPDLPQLIGARAYFQSLVQVPASSQLLLSTRSDRIIVRD